ncbi:helix-turn-helix domain-containing protein [Kordia sp.]|uniref:helix-turn-helix domain-containing protein n=1 Tax=Kordia sp. TaxID=1965332 RepID=UPI003D27EAF0
MRKLLLFGCLFFIGMILHSQEKDILGDEVIALKKKVLDRKVPIETAAILIYDYLEKAQQSNRKELIGRAYYLLSVKNTDLQKKAQFIDSALFYTKEIKGDSLFPMKAYFHKGVSLRLENDYQGALDKYILAESLAKAIGNTGYQHHVKFNIGLLKRRLGNYEEAVKLFKECQAYEESKKDMNVARYENILFQLSSIYYESGQVAKCSAINLQGIQLKLKKDKLGLYYNFVVNEGINLHIKEQYESSIDSIEKGVIHLKESHQAIANLYLAKSYYALGKKEKAVFLFKEIDSFFNKTQDLFPPLRESYEYLIKNAKEEKDKEQQLYYTEQLLEVDSMIHANYKYLVNTIVKKYDIPELIESRNNLITDLKNDKKQIIIGSILLVLLIVGLMLVYNYKLKQKYQKRYNLIIAQSNTITEEITITKDAELQPVIKDIDKDIVQEVLDQLDKFEQEKHYLTNQISLKEVAKIVNTNSKYLSKIINSYKEKNFATYINDLRIDYLIDRMQHDPIYRKYTIRAIAEEGGFSNPEGFFRAFQKKTGLKPSYFLKKIKESQQKKQ